jgi:hypothetical protein
MSDTPRTDAIAHRGFHLDVLVARSIDLCRELERENAALRCDRDRLDWLARNRSVSIKERPLFVTPESLRAAIDAARKEAQP